MNLDGQVFWWGDIGMGADVEGRLAHMLLRTYPSDRIKPSLRTKAPLFIMPEKSDSATNSSSSYSFDTSSGSVGPGSSGLSTSRRPTYRTSSPGNSWRRPKRMR